MSYVIYAIAKKRRTAEKTATASPETWSEKYLMLMERRYRANRTYNYRKSYISISLSLSRCCSVACRLYPFSYLSFPFVSFCSPLSVSVSVLFRFYFFPPIHFLLNVPLNLCVIFVSICVSARKFYFLCCWALFSTLLGGGCSSPKGSNRFCFWFRDSIPFFLKLHIIFLHRRERKNEKRKWIESGRHFFNFPCSQANTHTNMLVKLICFELNFPLNWMDAQKLRLLAFFSILFLI